MWDMYVMVLLLYTALYVPVKVAFFDETSDFMFAFDLIVDFSFLTDIVLTFFTSVEDTDANGITRMFYDKAEIAKRYLSGWFLIDLFTSIPF
jgi:hypothetical protein